MGASEGSERQRTQVTAPRIAGQLKEIELTNSVTGGGRLTCMFYRRASACYFMGKARRKGKIPNVEISRFKGLLPLPLMADAWAVST